MEGKLGDSIQDVLNVDDYQGECPRGGTAKVPLLYHSGGQTRPEFTRAACWKIQISCAGPRFQKSPVDGPMPGQTAYPLADVARWSDPPLGLSLFIRRCAEELGSLPQVSFGKLE